MDILYNKIMSQVKFNRKPYHITHNPEWDEKVSEPLVMHSNNGYYVGAISRYHEEGWGYLYQPYDRYTIYYDTPATPQRIVMMINDPNPNHAMPIESLSSMII